MVSIFSSPSQEDEDLPVEKPHEASRLDGGRPSLSDELVNDEAQIYH